MPKKYHHVITAEFLPERRSSRLGTALQNWIRRILGKPHVGWNDLSPREQQLLDLIGRNYTNSEIAFELGITERTVTRHIYNLRTKLGLANKRDLYYWYRDHRVADNSRAG